MFCAIQKSVVLSVAKVERSGTAAKSKHPYLRVTVAGRDSRFARNDSCKQLASELLAAIALSGRITRFMDRPRLIFALFALMILFSIVREWSASSVCARITIAAPTSHRALITSPVDIPRH